MWKQTKLERVHTHENKKSKARSGSAMSVSQSGKVEFKVRRKCSNLRSRSTGWLHRYQRRPASNDSKVLKQQKRLKISCHLNARAAQGPHTRLPLLAQLLPQAHILLPLHKLSRIFTHPTRRVGLQGLQTG
eukprot:g71411.t1